MKYINIKPVCARIFALALLVLCGLSPRVAAQGLYTLTNGRLWWSNGLENQSDEAYRDPVAFDASRSDASGNWLEVHPHGNDHVTHITAQGDTYLALDITTDPSHPAIVTKDTTQFDLYCVWRRTGTTGYYYQEWYNATDHKTYRYYLIATSDEGLFVSRVEVGKPLDKSTYFYNWDYGAAAWEKPLIDGVQKNRYYWIMLQERERTGNVNDQVLTNKVWALSNHCYQRPEDIYYTNYSHYAANPLDSISLKRYYDDVFDGVNAYNPVGNGALFMPVKEIPHDMQIAHIDIDAGTGCTQCDGKPYGLQRTENPTTHRTLGTGITIHDRPTSETGAQAITTLDYAKGEDTAILTAVMKYKVEGGVNKVPMTVVPAYTEYVEETYRRGIHLNYRYRNEEEVFGSAGQAEQWNRTFYHYNALSGGDAAVATSAPSSHTEATEVDTLYFYVDNRSLRYVKLDTLAYDPAHPEVHQNYTTLRVIAPVNGTHTVQIYVKVRYKNGAEQRDTVQLTLKYNKENVRPEAKNAPVVRGAVFGGGRMANVGGSTHIIVHSADSINTLYGGNDIAGWVQGDDGATIEIGTFYTNEEHPVHVGNVYGGGNGYYTYQGINAGYDEATGQHYNPYHRKQSTALMYSAYYFNGKVYPWNTLPDTYLTGTSENADALNKNQSAWSGFTPVVTHDFVYTPFYIGRPDLVDQAETGDDGDGTIPYIKTAHIKVGVPEGTTTIRNYNNTADSVVNTSFVSGDGDSTHVHNDYIIVDTVFGGARNAFIGVDANEGENAEQAVSVDINGGTCYAVFGGNNVGGSVANKATVFVNVNDTKLIGSDEEFEDTYLTGYGREFGIRYVYGGGNLVDGAHANVSIRGGLMDTVYLGGNNASVKNPIGLVECLQESDHHENGFGYDGHFICTNETYPNPKDFASVSPFQKYADDEAFFEHYGPDNFSPEEGLYNIRCLFGGNNAADMKNMSFIKLHSGGVSCVYGGGNRGDMVNDEPTYANSIYSTLMKTAFDLTIDNEGNVTGMKPDGWAEIYGAATLPQKVGSIVTALHNSKIVCDYVFGGGRMGNIKNSCGIYLAGGTYGYVNGGNDVSGDVGSETGGGTYVVLDSNVLIVGDAIAGSDGYYHCEAVDDNGILNGHYDDNELYDTYAEEGNSFSYDPFDDYVGMLFPSHNNVNFYMRGGLVLGNIVGGGVHTDVGFRNSSPKIKKIDTDPTHTETYGKRVELPLTLLGNEKSGSVHLMASGGHIVGNAFGGGFQSHIHGLAYLTLKGDVQIDGAFFCGNDCTGSINSFGAYVNMNDFTRYKAEHDGATDDDAMAYAYGQMKATDGTTALNSIDGSWNANYSAYLRIKDTPKISQVYGSGNGAYDYDGTRPEYEAISFCEDKTGLGLTPKQSSTFIDIHTSGGYIGTVFGGGNGVGVEKNVVVLLNNTENTVHTVHTIFGGNNKDDMLDVVPDIRLEKGIVNTVYGGCNNGVMGASKSFTDATGKQLKGVSTHVVLESPDITVLDTVFGGNRMSNVKGTTYVEVRNTKDEGVKYIFGGNDISGSIEGIARVDVSGGTVKNLFGGSNGRYDFVEIGDSLFSIYKIGFVDRHPNLFNGTDPDNPMLEDSLIATAARPDVDSTNINLWGGNVGDANSDAGGVYGGGAMADCRTTCVVVNDTVGGGNRELNIHGAIYGGGMGNYENLNNHDLQGNRFGNVTEATHVDLHHADVVSSAKAYGGGRGGDVYNTYITTHKGWTYSFDELYGGCWGSDVHGTTHVTINGQNLGEGIYNVKNLFGGNDFSGDVYKAEVTVNSGRYFDIYGAGNGDYSRTAYTTAPYTGNDTLRRPNVEYVNLTFNDGTVDDNLYGGGKLGTTFRYQRDTDREFVITNGHKVPDTTLTYGESHSDPLDYSYIITNIHGGTFKNNIFAGARGDKSNKTALVYGLKVLNMDGGHVYESVYGGSQSVNDGYAKECTHGNTTKRPSSILNLTGGTVENNLYGAGYLGQVHGSTYVNIGTDAIDSCVAYQQAYKYGSGNSAVGSAAKAYKIFKPGEEGGLSPALGRDVVLLNRSIYAGANWGTGGGSSDFTGRGFNGGESKIRIDGKGYNTNNDELNANPEMNIAKSVFCSGTSVEGGDVRDSKDIDIWNYGEIVNCLPTRKLESVQRSDHLMFHNSAIELTGAIDATSAYQSIPYSLKNIESALFRGYNVLRFDAVIDNVYNLFFYEEPILTDGGLQLVPVQRLRQYNSEYACGEQATICANLEVVDPKIVNKQHTMLILDKGIEFLIKNNGTFGWVSGFGYVTTPEGYASSIIATATAYDDDGQPASLIEDGFTWEDGISGFVSACNDNNLYTEDRGGYPVNWIEATTDEQKMVTEIPYTNYYNPSLYDEYREWKIGSGTRLAETAILAHANPEALDQDVSILTHGNSKMAIAEASVQMPATSAGHYYKLASGVTLTGENDVVNLIDSAFLPAENFSTLKSLYDGDGTVDDNAASPTYTHGKFLGTTLANVGIPSGVSDIIDHPTNTFGLVMAPGENFAYNGTFSEYYSMGDTANFVMPAFKPEDGAASRLFVLSGNSHVTSFDHYYTPVVTQGAAITPTLKFYLTYNTDFTTAFLGTVEFTLDEYIDVKKRDADGYLVNENGERIADADDNFISGFSADNIVWVAKNLNSPIKVKVYISTILEDFKPINTEVLAMYNVGRTNTFTRKVVLPATLEEDRELYLQSVKWVPTNPYGVDSLTSERFFLAGNESTITGAGTGVNNLFALNIIPNEDVSNDLASNLGWSHIDETNINVYDLKGIATTAHEFPSRYSDSTGLKEPKPINLINADSRPYGLKIGTLDGRGTAVLDVQLTFDGERIYPDIKGKGYVGKLILNLSSIKGETAPKEFTLTVYVKTRDQADTIYIASADSVTRGGQKVKPYAKNALYRYHMGLQNTPPTGFENVTQSRDAGALMVGKSPNCYVQNFQEALSTKVYQEGDVLCILDTVKIDNKRGVAIHGGTGPAIEVIAYDAHHYEMKGEAGVYRGPMIQVKNNGSKFTSTNIAFHGGAGAIILDLPANRPQGSTYIETFTSGYAKYPDTNATFAPIFQIMDNGEVVLNEGTKVQYRWNAYGSVNLTDGTPGDQLSDAGLPVLTRNMGAISITNEGKLTLHNNVSVDHNLSHTFDGDNPAITASYDVLRPFNGAVYVDGGRILLPQSNALTAVTITNNWLVNPQIHDLSNNVTWWKNKLIGENLVRWEFDDTKVTSWQKANVFLTRKAATSGNVDMNDAQSDVITLMGTVAPATRIAVRKWFPGPDVRDTIRFADCGTSNLTVLSQAKQNGNFLSDDAQRIFYNAEVNNNAIYFFRCATFRHQMLDVNLPLAKRNQQGTITGYYKGQDVLHYGILENNSCPTGGDTIIYRLQGGLAPYKYTWSGDLAYEHTSPYPNSKVEDGLKHGDTSYYWASISDTLVTPAIDMAFGNNNLTANIKVTAVDATDECELSKDIQISLHKVGDLGSHQKWEPTISPNNGWTDTASVVTVNRKTAEGNRYYKAVKVTPYVWTDGSQGKISARVEGNDNDIVYNYIDDEHRHELESQLFCEGDIIMLKTQPTYDGAKFLMWSFNPFNVNPAAFVVPPQDAEVIAYYGSNIYWADTINTLAEAGVKNASGYYYSSRPNADATYKMFSGKYEYDETKAGYVTTYSGDVHIYNENGLAWFISVVNGLNGNQARPFRYNTVYLHQKRMQRRDPDSNLVTSGGQPVMVDTCYDMKKFLWTPVGTRQYGFRGRFIGVGSDDADTARLHHYEDKSTNPPTLIGDDAALATWLADAGHSVDNVDTVYDRVVVKNIVLNEPNMDYVGFFGLLEEAKCQGVALQDVFVRGGQYVGGFTAQSKGAKVDNCAVVSDPTKSETTSIIATNYVSGGMMGDAANSTIMNSMVEAKYTGNAIHSGGVTGTGKSDTIRNNVVRVNDQMNGIYVGYLTGDEAATDEEACVANLSAEVDMNSSTPGYTINVSWQRLSPRRIYLGYCAGNSWDGSDDDLQQVSGSSKTLYIPANTANTVSGYTIYLKAECSDGNITELSKYVSVDSITPIPCPVYTVEGNISEIEGQTSDQMSYELAITWYPDDYQYEVPTEGITAGYCVGTDWNADNATITRDGTSDGAYFTLQTLATAYVVGVYSDCDQQWYTRPVTPNLCPEYDNVDASYSTAHDPETTTVVHHYATVTWRNTTSNQEPNNEIIVFFCPGDATTQLSDNCMRLDVYADSNRNNDGNCSAKLCIDDLISGNPNITDFTMTLKSPCNSREYSATFSTTNTNPQGRNRRSRDNRQTPGRKTVTGGRSVIANNYVEVVNSGSAQRVGGIAGRAKNTDIMNNYVYGTIVGSETGGSVAAVLDQGSRAIDNFAAQGTAAQTVGYQQGGMIRNSANFTGQGNQVILDKRINGVNNLTRVLNRWVREQNAQGGAYRTWRSDLDGENNGYPVFGIPDIIAAQGTQYFEGCDEVVINGVSYTRDSSFTVRFIDSVEMVDSTLTAHIVLHQSTRTEVSDTASLETGYNGHGFSITPEELRLLNHTVDSTGRATLIVTDTFSTAYGCDSVVVLTLTYQTSSGVVEVEEGSPVQIYPNPTTSVVYVEAKAMSHVEVYDNEGRILQDYDAFGKDQVVVDMTMYLSGVYYVRVHTPEEVIIQKVIKER